jgi:peptide/nickel transport system permease protein
VDQPYPVQLLIFVKQILTFDFGNGWRTGEPVRHILTSRPGPSLTVLDTVPGVALALAARAAGFGSDRFGNVGAAVGGSDLASSVVKSGGMAYACRKWRCRPACSAMR